MCVGGDPFGGIGRHFGGMGGDPFGGMGGGMPQQRQRTKPPAVEQKLAVSLEDLFYGATKKLKNHELPDLLVCVCVCVCVCRKRPFV